MENEVRLTSLCQTGGCGAKIPAGRLTNVIKNIPVKKDSNLLDRKSTRLNSSHIQKSRMPSSA